MDISTPGKTSQQEALALRYGAATPPAGPWNDHIALLPSHRSVRGYWPNALPARTLENLDRCRAIRRHKLQIADLIGRGDRG